MKTYNKYVTFIAPATLALIVIFMMLFSANTTRIMSDKSARFAVMQNASGAAKTVEGTVNYMSGSIREAVASASYKMVVQGREGPEDLIRSLAEEMPFLSLEYISRDGNGMSEKGAFSDVSGRGYFSEGMKGQSGIWVDSSTDEDDEVRIYFYSPLMYDGRITGVMAGVLGGNTNICPGLMSTFFGEKLTGVLCDSSGRIISSTSEYQKGMNVYEYLSESGVSDKQISLFRERIDSPDAQVFDYKDSKGSAIACAAAVQNTDWTVFYIVPSASVKKAHNRSMRNMNVSVITIISSFAVYLFYVSLKEKRKRVKIISENQKLTKENEKERERRIELDETVRGLAEEYSALYYAELFKNNTVSYYMDEFARTTYGAPFLEDNANFFDVINENYIDNYVHPDDIADFRRMCTEQNVYSELKTRKSFSIYFRVKRGTEEYHHYKLHMVKIGDSKSEPQAVILGFVNRDDQVRQEAELKQAGEREALLKDKTEKLSEDVYIDILTGLFNRRAYEEDWKNYMDSPPENEYVYAALDVNGLKEINDSQGHESGDELIKGAAECMNRVFGPYGKVYRIGGDEFAAMLAVNEEKLKELRKEFNELVSSWSGERVKELAVSAGYVLNREIPGNSMPEIAKTADKRMYQDKSRYYTRKGIDRRGNQDAFRVLSDTYSKIIKADLAEDTCTVIRIEESEKNNVHDKLSDWINDFSDSGLVHEEDLEKFRSVIRPAYIHNYFCGEENVLSIHYRRKVNGEYRNMLMEIIRSKDYSDDLPIVYIYVKIID